jgi:beta-glucosidase
MKDSCSILLAVLVLGFSAHPLLRGQAISDAEASAQADKLLAQMTTEEKQLQLLAYCPNGVPRLGIPALHAGEVLHGAVAQGCTSFPMSIALGATWDPGLMKQIGTVVAAEARAVGIEQGFAPMLGLARDPRWGRVEESYGEDPYLVSEIGTAYIEGLQGMGDDRFGPNRIIATPKHFVADGEPWAGANGEDYEISERVLREVYFPPFASAVEVARAGSIMPAHHALNGVPCHANAWLLETVLRQEWGFQGFVTSDMGDIPKLASGHKFARDDSDAAVKALSAGVDMELVGHLYKGALSDALKANRISIDLVNRAAKRVLCAKIQLLGLMTPTPTPPPDTAPPDATRDAILHYKGTDDVWAKLIAEGKFDSAENLHRPDAPQVLADPQHEALALKAAQEEIVLLKNDHMLLPLKRTLVKNLLVVGPLARMSNLGGYSGRPRFTITILDGIKAEAGESVHVNFAPGCNLTRDDDTLLADAVTAAKTADVIVAVVGFTRQQAGENLDRDTLDLIGGQEKLVEAMQASGKPVVVVLSNGAPLSIDWIQEHVPAIVENWYGGQAAGRALAQVLFGEVNPGGRLNVSFPRSVGQVPCYYNHLPITGPINYYQAKGGVLYPFGFGLSYTSFAYSDLKVDRTSIGKDEVANVSATIQNTGSVAGDEVVQFYVRQDYTSLVRPVRELKGFQRLTLQPGEKRTVSFPVGFEQVKFWKDGKWVAEPGQINLLIGSSCDDIRLKGAVQEGGS